jgi:hypothetical protein
VDDLSADVVAGITAACSRNCGNRARKRFCVVDMLLRCQHNFGEHWSYQAAVPERADNLSATRPA